MNSLSRREFCGYTCLGLGFLAACTSGGTPSIQTGGLGGGGGGGGGGGPDAPNPDAGSDHSDGGMPDAANAGACQSGITPTDCGEPTAFTTDDPTYFSSGNFFVVRDSGGLYAVSARCTHAGATIEVQGSQFYCPRHGATFTFDGDVTGGPASTPLPHYEACLMSNGHVGVDTAKTVSESTRLDA